MAVDVRDFVDKGVKTPIQSAGRLAREFEVQPECTQVRRVQELALAIDEIIDVQTQDYVAVWMAQLKRLITNRLSSHPGAFHQEGVRQDIRGVIIPAGYRQDLAARHASASIFNALVEQWSTDTLFQSSIQTISMHPAYQKIIGLGPQALPFIFHDLYNRKSLWFWALHAITGEDPVQQGDSGAKAVDAWAAWGRAHGYTVGIQE